MNGFVINKYAKYVLVGLLAVAVAAVLWLVWNRMHREGYENEITITNHTKGDVDIGFGDIDDLDMLTNKCFIKRITIPGKTSIRLKDNEATPFRTSSGFMWMSPGGGTTMAEFIDTDGKRMVTDTEDDRRHDYSKLNIHVNQTNKAGKDCLERVGIPSDIYRFDTTESSWMSTRTRLNDVQQIIINEVKQQPPPCEWKCEWKCK